MNLANETAAILDSQLICLPYEGYGAIHLLLGIFLISTIALAALCSYLAQRGRS